jgi:hypothetical protein
MGDPPGGWLIYAPSSSVSFWVVVVVVSVPGVGCGSCGWVVVVRSVRSVSVVGALLVFGSFGVPVIDVLLGWSGPEWPGPHSCTSNLAATILLTYQQSEIRG